eukprot:361013-Chlamydomonas_euryale.AAC.3
MRRFPARHASPGCRHPNADWIWWEGVARPPALCLPHRGMYLTATSTSLFARSVDSCTRLPSAPLCSVRTP